MRILKISVVLFIFTTVLSFSENIRGPVVKIIDSETLASSKIIEFDLSPEELFSISTDMNNLPDKISLEIRSSDNIKKFRDSFSIYSYTNVSPMPDKENKSYKGSYSESLLIPDRTRFFVDIILSGSFTDKNRLKGTEVLNFSSLKNNRPFMFTILPVMKGVPDYLFSENFRIKITPQWPETGKLMIKVFTLSSDGNVKTEISDYSLDVDGNNFSIAENISLKTGIHALSVAKEGFLTYEENISINTNQTREVEVLLKKNNPHLTVFSPDESVFYIDGNIQNTRKISDLDPGEHTIVFKLGEYSLSRNILLEEGKNYTVNLLLDIEIKEE